MGRRLRPKRSIQCKVRRGDRQPSIEEDPGKTVEDIAKKQDVNNSRLGHMCMIRMHGRDGEREQASRSQVVCSKKESTKERSVSRIIVKQEHAKEARQESKSQEQPAQKTCTCPTPSRSTSSNKTMRGTSKRCDDEQVRAEVKRPKASSGGRNLMRGALRVRGDEEIREETKKPKLKCLSMESKLIEDDPTFVVTGNNRESHVRLGRHINTGR